MLICCGWELVCSAAWDTCSRCCKHNVRYGQPGIPGFPATRFWIWYFEGTSLKLFLVPQANLQHPCDRFWALLIFKASNRKGLETEQRAALLSTSTKANTSLTEFVLCVQQLMMLYDPPTHTHTLSHCVKHCPSLLRVPHPQIWADANWRRQMGF